MIKKNNSENLQKQIVDALLSSDKVVKGVDEQIIRKIRRNENTK